MLYQSFHFLLFRFLETYWRLDRLSLGCVIGSRPMINGGVAYDSHSIIDGGGVAHGLILRPYGVNKRSIFIQWLSFCRLSFLNILGQTIDTYYIMLH